MKKLFTVILALGMLFLSACSEVPAIEAQQFEESSQTESELTLEEEKAPEEFTEIITTPDPEVPEPEKTPEPVEDDADHVREQAEPSRTAAPKTTPRQSETEREQEKAKVPVNVEIIDDQKDTETDPDPGSSNPTPEPKPVVTPSPEPDPDDSEEEPEDTPAVEPAPDPIPEPTPEPEPEPTPEPEPAFDISYWVSFAKSYGKQVGLSYDAQATDCWDNPIIASSESIYLERDITSRLKRYVREGMTAFCVWSEPLADGRYNIYIGYA